MEIWESVKGEPRLLRLFSLFGVKGLGLGRRHPRHSFRCSERSEGMTRGGVREKVVYKERAAREDME